MCRFIKYGLCLCVLLVSNPVIATEDGYHWELVNDGELVVSSTEDTEGYLDLGFPSIIEVPSWATSKPDPDARFYMYYGEHHAKPPTQYIRMKWAKDTTGPWYDYHVGEVSNGHTLQGVMDFMGDSYRNPPGGTDEYGHTATGWSEDWVNKGHIAGPDVYIDEENQIFIMAFHGKCGLETITHDDGEDTEFAHTEFVAFSQDGLNFNDPVTGGGQSGLWGPVGYELPFGPLEQEALYNGEIIQRTQNMMKSYARLFTLNGTFYGYGQGNSLGGPSPVYRPENPSRPWHIPASLVGSQNKFEAWWEKCDTEHINNFFDSQAFALHPNNPHPGQNIEPFYRVNHPEVVKLSEERIEIYLYIKPDTATNELFSQLLRVELDVSDPDWNNWDVAKNSSTGEDIFDVVADPGDIYAAVQDAIGGGGIDGLEYADPIRTGVPGVITVEGTKYCFIGFKGEDTASQARDTDSEGQIACLILTPKEAVYNATNRFAETFGILKPTAETFLGTTYTVTNHTPIAGFDGGTFRLSYDITASTEVGACRFSPPDGLDGKWGIKGGPEPDDDQIESNEWAIIDNIQVWDFNANGGSMTEGDIQNLSFKIVYYDDAVNSADSGLIAANGITNIWVDFNASPDGQFSGHDPSGEGSVDLHQMTGSTSVERFYIQGLTSKYRISDITISGTVIIPPSAPEMDLDLSQSGAVISWDSISNLAYGVFWSSNLVDGGFHPLETNLFYPQNRYTDTVFNTESVGYYKMDVRLR